MVTWYIAFGVDLLWPIAHRPVCRLGESSQQILNLVLPLSGKTALSSAFVSRRNQGSRIFYVQFQMRRIASFHDVNF